MQLHFCGVRGSTPAPGIEFVRYGGHTSCVALSHDGDEQPTLVLDAGAGLQRLARRFGATPFAGTILLTHLHWDHVLGLPFFAPADREEATVEVLLPEQGDGSDAASVLAGMMSPPYFPVGPTQLRGQWSFGTVEPGTREIAGFEVLAREIPHKGGRTYGYRVSDGHSTITYMPDHCPTMFGPGEDGFGDYHAAALELAADSDVLIHDAQLLPAELASEADFGHAVADYSHALARHANARAVAFFHHRHNRTDDALDALAARFADASPPVTVASEETRIDL